MSHSRDGSSSSSTRSASRSGGRPTTANPRPSTSDAYSRRPFSSSLSPSPSFDKVVPSFLRPTVSSSLRSTSPSPTTRSRPSSSKGSPLPAQLPAAGRATRPSTPKRSPAQEPASSSRPVTPKRSPVQPVSAPRSIAPAMDKAKAKAKSASTSRWSVASPRLLMQKASNAFIKAGKMRSKKNKDLAGPAASAVASVNKDQEASGAASCEIKTETERAPPVEMQPPEMATVIPQEEVITTTVAPQEEAITTTVAPAPEEEVIATTEAPLRVQEVVIVEPNAVQNSTEIKTKEDSGQVEQVSIEEPTGDAEKAIEEQHSVMPEESVEALKVDTLVPEEKPQIGEVDETEKDAEKKTEDELPPAAVVEESAKEPAAPATVVEEPAAPAAVVEESAEEPAAPAAVVEESAKETAAPLNVQYEPATSTAKEVVVVEIKVAEERQPEESPKHEEITENSENSVTPEEVTAESSEKSVTISEEPKEQPAAAEKQDEEVAEEPQMIAASRASSLPATSLEEALEEMEATTKGQASTSRSEPVTPTKKAVRKDKAVIDTLLSASAPTTPAKGDTKMGGPSPLLARIPEEMRLSFKGSRVKTALERRPEEAQPKKKEVVRSNDVLQEAKSKLLEKKKSKVGALVGAFETVMDSSPRASTPGARSKPTLR